MNNKQLVPTEDNLSDTVVAASAQGGGAQMVREQPAAQLFPDTESHDFRARWERIQVNFVDEPRRAVQEADGLVADTMKRLIDNFSGERKKMEAVWVRGDDVSTEDLRVSLQRYRSFFNRLLTL
jgi:hypothetical protein